MTPLAAAVLRHTALGLDGLTLEDPDNLCDVLPDAHFFEITQAMPAVLTVNQYRADENQNALFVEENADHLFLPAPVTWLELSQSFGRKAYLCTERGDEDPTIDVSMAVEMKKGLIDVKRLGQIFSDRPDVVRLDHAADEFQRSQTRHRGATSLLATLFTILALINSQSVDQIDRDAHRGLRRKLGKAGHAVGPEWVEVVLDATAARSVSEPSDGEPTEDGPKVRRHFCRSHLRVRKGNIERVRSHWKGSAALGIVKTRYKMAPIGGETVH